MDQYLLATADTAEWQKLYSIAQADKSHGLWENYQNIDLDTYEHMIVTMRNGETASFQGIYNNGRWPSNVSRFCNRAYINPYFRNLGQGLEITYNNVKYTLDNYAQWGKDVLFISRGVQYDNAEISWKKFEKFCKFLIKNTGYNLIYDDRLYQCCANNCKDCYQFCVWYDPMYTKEYLNIPSISKDEWQQLVAI
jgi:hypothetical protein